MAVRRLIPVFLALAVGSATVATVPEPAQAETTSEPGITITSPEANPEFHLSSILVSGTYTRAADLVLVVNAQQEIPIETTGDSGTWSKRILVNDLDGVIYLGVYGNSLVTGYDIWSDLVPIELDHPAAAEPQVQITSPEEGQVPGAETHVRVSAEAPLPIHEVQVRVNGQEWQEAEPAEDGDGYVADVDLPQDRFSSIEARAETVRGVAGQAGTVYVSTGDAQAQEPVRYDQDRAMWVWERAAYEAVFDEDAAARMAAVMDDTKTFDSDPMTTIYLGVDKFEGRDMLRGSREEVAEFLTWAHERGYTVQATVAGGTNPPYMGALEQFQHFAVDEFEKVLNYNLAVPAEARFDGVNVDIEPYILGAWPEGDLPHEWLEILDKLIERRDASGLPLLFGPAIPRWLDSSDCCQNVTWQGKTAVLSDHIQDMTDYIAIMDYRDTANGGAGIIAQAEHEIAYANQIGKEDSVVLGIETQLLNTGDPETVTFWEEGRDVAERELEETYAAFGGNPAFGGIAMHHYDSLLIFPSNWQDPTYYPVPGAGPDGPVMPDAEWEDGQWEVDEDSDEEADEDDSDDDGSGDVDDDEDEEHDD